MLGTVEVWGGGGRVIPRGRYRPRGGTSCKIFIGGYNSTNSTSRPSRIELGGPILGLGGGGGVVGWRGNLNSDKGGGEEGVR